MKLSDIKQLLADHQIQLTKSLGQNFMHDGNQLRRIADVAELSSEDSVLEIGPGLGPLTELLLAKAGRVLAIEKDHRLCPILQERFGTLPHFTLVNDDALEFLEREKRDWSRWKLVSNLPYSVGSRILVDLAVSPQGPTQMVVTLQREVVDRLLARAGEPTYGLLTLLVGLHYEPKAHFKVPAGCFFPAPDIDSACISLVRRSQTLLDAAQSECYRKLVKLCFSQRRKTAAKLLKDATGTQDLPHCFAQARIPIQARAESISIEQFAILARILSL